ncbi:MAG: hypothetical protein NG740_00695 [Omnitrophica bacterium]|nr:hypothetical protein [Candidatus Omnitrophota bacterium]
MKILPLIISVLMISTYTYANTYENQIKKISNKVVKGCSTVEEKIRLLRKYVHEKMKFPEPRVKPNGEPLKPSDIYVLNTIERLESGLGGWCDQQVDVFMDLAKKQGINSRKVFLHIIKDGTRTSPHTFAEAQIGRRWVIVDTLYDLELVNMEGEMASRSDIAKDVNILRNNPTIKKFAKNNPNIWTDENYLSMYYNNLGAVVKNQLGE